MKITVAAIQMRCETLDVETNLARADGLLRQAFQAGAELAVLPELFNTGYSLCPDFGPFGESIDGPTWTHLRQRSRQWGIAIAAGFVERAGYHLHDSLGFVTPDGTVHVYRKRNLVFWERFRFYPGRAALVVPTRWGRIGFAVCADMIYQRVWREYRGEIDMAIVSAAWPDFADRSTGRKHWLFGHVGPLSEAIPGKVAEDLGIPVIFANQCGEAETVIPVLKTKIADRFAGRSSISDGRHEAPLVACTAERVLLSTIRIDPAKGTTWHSTSNSVTAA